MKHRIGDYLIIALVFINLIVWLAFPPVFENREGFILIYIGEILGSTAIILMACSLFLSTRARWVEPFFGGLDKMYVTHRHTSIAAFIILIVHVIIVPISYGLFSVGNYLALVAFIGITGIVILTFDQRIRALHQINSLPYETWKKIHRFVGVFFILGFLHAVTVDTALDALVAITWVQVFFIIGVASYLYTELFSRLTKRYQPYQVISVKNLNQSVAEITLSANREGIKRHKAGQFLFIRFPDSNLLDQPHPFTISSSPKEKNTRLAIKASGDFTAEMQRSLSPDMKAIVEGPYGMFHASPIINKEIWIAGGIGVTPFLAMIRSLQIPTEEEIIFFYSIRNKDDAIYLDEILAAEQDNPGFRVILFTTEDQGRLTIDKIKTHLKSPAQDYQIFICGPQQMIAEFTTAFREEGVPRKHIHFDVFNLR